MQSRSIPIIITDIKQIIEELSTHGSDYDVAIELSHQLIDEIVDSSDEDALIDLEE